MSFPPEILPIAHRISQLFDSEPGNPSSQAFGQPLAAINGVVIQAGTCDWMLNYRLDPMSPNFAKDWGQLFANFNPELTWIELLQIAEPISELANVSATDLFLAYRQRMPDPRLKMILGKLPASAVDWLITKKVGAVELSPLFSFGDPSQSQAFDSALQSGLGLFWPSLEKLSRQDGIKALELWTELVLNQIPADELGQKLDETQAAWLERLKTLRYPQTSQQDNIAKSWLLSKQWPRGLHLRWVRTGDQSGVELKIILRRNQDLQSLVKTIPVLEQTLNEAPESLWPKN